MAEKTKKRSQTASLLCDIRTKGTRDITSAKKLLEYITGREDWTYSQCQRFYESLLTYYVDDSRRLEMLRALSGLSEGYKSIPIAKERCEKYLDYLSSDNIQCEYLDMSEETLKKRAEAILQNIADRLEIDIASGKTRQLVDEWTLEPEREETSETDSKTDTTGADRKPSDSPYSIQINQNYYSFQDDGAGKSKDVPDTEGAGDEPAEVDPPIIDPKPQDKPSSKKKPIICLVLIFVLVIGGMLAFIWSVFHGAPESVIDDPVEEIPLRPGQVFAIKPVITSSDALVQYTSSNSDIVEITPDGLVTVCGGPEAAGSTVEISITGDGISQKKIITVIAASEEFPPVDLEHLEPGYTVQVKARVAGTKEWATSVSAEIGDTIEFQAQFLNTGDTLLENVMVRDILATNLAYIPGTTKLYNVTLDGSALSDGVTNEGVNIGNYTSGSNAYVRFSAKVVDVNLAPGSNTLVTWSQVGVGQVTLQDYAAVVVQR